MILRKMNKEQYLLIKLSEECSEVSQITSKSLRFGIGNIRPDSVYTNSQKITQELADVMAAAMYLEEEGVINMPGSAMIQESRDKIDKYLEYSKLIGIVKDGDI